MKEGLLGHQLHWKVVEKKIQGYSLQRATFPEGLRDVLIPETLDVVFEENNGALVLVAGKLNIQDTLKDDFYGISMAAVKMRKVVQVYQWYETEDERNHNIETGDHDNHVEKSYSYDTDWFDHHIDSSNFANTLGWYYGHFCCSTDNFYFPRPPQPTPGFLACQLQPPDQLQGQARRLPPWH